MTTLTCSESLSTLRSRIEICLLGFLLASDTPVPEYYSPFMIHCALTRYGAVPGINFQHLRGTCDQLRAFSTLLAAKIAFVTRDRMTIAALFDRRTHLPPWLQRRLSTEKFETKEKALWVANQWQADGVYVDMINELLRIGEDIVVDVERMLGIQNLQFAVPRFIITWEYGEV